MSTASATASPRAMSGDRSWMSWTGVLGFIVLLVSIFIGPKAPSDKASGTKVLAWYRDHHSADQFHTTITAIGVSLMVLFICHLYAQLGGAGTWRRFGMFGFIMAIVGFATAGAFDIVLSGSYGHLSASTAQTLGVLNQDFFLPVIVGFGIFGVGFGMSALEGHSLPGWMGWVATVVGVLTVVFFATSVGFIGLIVMVFWLAAVSIWLGMRGPQPQTA